MATKKGTSFRTDVKTRTHLPALYAAPLCVLPYIVRFTWRQRISTQGNVLYVGRMWARPTLHYNNME